MGFTLLEHILASTPFSFQRNPLEIVTESLYIGIEPRKTLEPLCDVFRMSGTDRRAQKQVTVALVAEANLLSACAEPFTRRVRHYESPYLEPVWW